MADTENTDIPFDEGPRQLYTYRCPHCEALTKSDKGATGHNVECVNVLCRREYPRVLANLVEPLPVIDFPRTAERERAGAMRELARSNFAVADALQALAGAVYAAIENERGR